MAVKMESNCAIHSEDTDSGRMPGEGHERVILLGSAENRNSFGQK